MHRPPRWLPIRGLLLIEAVLAAVVIATGLVFVSRGLGSQLAALRRIEEYDHLIALAGRKLAELEAQRLPGPPHLEHEARRGVFELEGDRAQGDAYEWQVAAIPRPDLPTDAGGHPLYSEVTLIVRHANHPRSPVVSLSEIWPNNWVLAEWFSG